MAIQMETPRRKHQTLHIDFQMRLKTFIEMEGFLSEKGFYNYRIKSSNYQPRTTHHLATIVHIGEEGLYLYESQISECGGDPKRKKRFEIAHFI